MKRTKDLKYIVKVENQKENTKRTLDVINFMLITKLINLLKKTSVTKNVKLIEKNRS